MSLILPKSVLRDSRRPIVAPLKQFYSPEGITGHRALVADIVGELQPVPRNEALRWVCALSNALLSKEALSANVQLQWARELLPKEWCESLQSTMKSDGQHAGLVFHRRSIWFVLQMALLSCRESGSEMSNEEAAQRVGRACFLANDIVQEIESESQAALSQENATEWMVSALIPISEIDGPVDLNVVGRAIALWEDSSSSAEFKKALQNRRLDDLEATFSSKYGVPLGEFLRFVVALYIRFFGTFQQNKTNPLLLDVHSDEPLQKFDAKTRNASLKLIAQTPDELSAKLFRSRHSWVTDVTPLRERPLLEIENGKCCCPDLTILVRACVDRVYFLLQKSYTKSQFGGVFGALFEGYLNELLRDVTVPTGGARVFLPSSKFAGSTDEGADGILHWVNTAAIMEYKAVLLTTRERYAGDPEVLLKGIESKLSTDKKGVAQLAKKIGRILKGERVSVHDYRIDLSSYRRLFPVLVCFDETLGIHAVTKHLQNRFTEELIAQNVNTEKVAPLMLLSIRDFENLVTAAHSVSIEDVLGRYAHHLETEEMDYMGSFTSVLEDHFGQQIDWLRSKSFLKHQELIKELLARLGPSASLDSDVG